MTTLLMAGIQPVPSEPPLEQAVAPNYERLDGYVAIDDTMTTGPAQPAPAQHYRPGQLAADGSHQGGITGTVGSVGATPLPVAQALWKPASAMVATNAGITVTQPGGMGPGGQAPGIAGTIFKTDLVNAPPTPEALADIFTSF